MSDDSSPTSGVVASGSLAVARRQNENRGSAVNDSGTDVNRSFWVVRAGSGGRHAQEFWDGGFVAIGFDPMPSVEGMTREQVRAKASEAFPEESSRARAGFAGMLYRFANEISVGDAVITPDGETRELLLGEVTGRYEYRDPAPVGGFHHVRAVQWAKRESRDKLPQRVLYSLGSTLTVFQPKGVPFLSALYDGSLVDSGPDGEPESDEVEEEDETVDLFADLQSRATELIKNAIADLDGYESQELVAGIYRAMGYYATATGPGADGGVDVVASRDPLGVEPPVIKTQVKARPSTRSSPDEIRALAGVITEGDRGVFVSTGGFTGPAESEASARRITLIDMDRLYTLVVEHYDRLDKDSASLVPLRRLYFPAGSRSA